MKEKRVKHFSTPDFTRAIPRSSRSRYAPPATVSHPLLRIKRPVQAKSLLQTYTFIDILRRFLSQIAINSRFPSGIALLLSKIVYRLRTFMKCGFIRHKIRGPPFAAAFRARLQVCPIRSDRSLRIRLQYRVLLKSLFPRRFRILPVHDESSSFRF